MRLTSRLVLFVLLSASGPIAASGLPVVATRPRVFLTPAIETALKARAAANDPSWLAVKAQADTLVTYTIFPYTYATRTSEPDNTIFYDYQGSGWWEAAVPLGLAWRVTGNAAYANKLVQLADEMIRAQSAPENNPPTGRPPLQPDSYFPTRFVGPVIGLIYDWCYAQLGATRRAQMVTLMNAYFDDLRANAYQANDNADGNYFGGHLICAAWMGYATAGDNPRAQEMIDYARIRFDGTPSALVPPANVPSTHFDQCFEGGFPPALGSNIPSLGLTGAPFKGGLDFQGWAYGTGEYIRILDYMLVVRSATTEDVITARLPWLSQILRAEKQALLPNRFWIDPVGDWGGDYGPVIDSSLPARLAFLLAGTADGPGAQHFLVSEIDGTATYPDGRAQFTTPWEVFFFGDGARPSAELVLPPYHSGFANVAPPGGTNGAIPYFLMRSDWGKNAVWASLAMGNQWYDDHQHENAGHLELVRGADDLLVDGSQWMGPAGSTGILGGSTEADHAASANTLWFDDFGDYMYTGVYYSGGQGVWGVDAIAAAEQNDLFTYVRSDLTPAYYRSSDNTADWANRKLASFYRSVLYLRASGLFAVYDEVTAKSSTNPRGAYLKKIRWHVPNVPTVAGKSVRVDQGASRLWLDVVLPAAATLHVVDESSNPEPCDVDPAPCTPYGDNSGTYRIEVSDPANPLAVPFLTVLAPGPSGTVAPTVAALASNDGKMTGAVVTAASSAVDVILFNAGAGASPAAVTATSYGYTGPAGAIHTLCGMDPNALYAITWSAGLVTVAESGSGTARASMSGVLRFTLAPSVGPLTFYAVTPCRLLDTRTTSDAPSLSAGASRLVTVAARCAVPAGARAAAANLTVVAGASAGFLTAYPDGVSRPGTSTVSFTAGRVRAGSLVLGLSPAGNANVYAGIGSGAVDVILDVAGYFK